MDTVKIDARDVNFWYGDFHALKGISMQIEEKSVVSLYRPVCSAPFQAASVSPVYLRQTDYVYTL